MAAEESPLRFLIRWLQSIATGTDTCFGMDMDDLVPFWTCVFAICGVVYYKKYAKEGQKPKLERSKAWRSASLLGVWFCRHRSSNGMNGRERLLDDVHQKLEAAHAPPRSICEAARMLSLCSELGIQRGLEAACVAVLLVLQHRRRYGAASIAVLDGTSTRKLHVPVDLEAPVLTFSELVRAVDRALCEPAAASNGQGEETSEVIFHWGAKVTETGKWCARTDSTGKNVLVVGSSAEEAQSFQILFDAVAGEASMNVLQLPILSRSAAEAVETWGRPALCLDSVKDSTSGCLLPMPRLLAARGHASSDRLAVAGNGFGLSHRELHRRAAAVGEAILRAKATSTASSPSPSAAVVLYMGRGEAIAPAFLGVLQAGCHVVPADVHWPLERVSHVAEASNAVAVLVGASTADAWHSIGSSLPCLAVDEALFAQGSGSTDGLAVERLQQDDPAVVLFTSGSTGLPKGIVLSHGYLTALVVGIVESKRMTADTRTLCYHSPTWMPFLDYIFGPLLTGGCCLYFPEGQSHVVTPKDLRTFGIRHSATNAGFVPAMLDILLEEGLPPTFSDVGVGGAAVPAELCVRAVAALQAISPSTVLYTGYSGTEQGDVTQLKMRGDEDVEAGTSDGGYMGAGRPHGAQRCKILDQCSCIVGPGGVGEICVSGPGLASGYLQLPDKTAETFLPSAPAFGGERIARSGDLGKWTANGNLKVVGRRDSMVKVRGARIELGEVEAVVNSHAAVKAAVVTVWEDQLVAYVVPAIPADLRDHCKSCLVPYMVPHMFEGLEELPRLPNGKVNKRALPTPAKRADGAETVMELDSLGQMRKFTRKAASEDRVLDNVRAILIAVVIQSHAIKLHGTSLAMYSAQDVRLGADWGPVQALLLRLVYSGGWSSLAFLSGFDDTRSMKPYGLTYREALFILLWPMLGFMWTLWYLPVFVYMRVVFCAAHHAGIERLHILVASQFWILMPAFVDLYTGWTPNGPQGECPSQCFCPFKVFPEVEPVSKLLCGWWVNETGDGTGNFTRMSFLGHGLIFIPCYWMGFYTGGPIFRVLTRVADEPSMLRRGLVAAVVFAVYLVMYRAPVTDEFSDRCGDFWGPGGGFVYEQVLKNLLYYSMNLIMSLLYVFFIAACVPVHLKHLAKVSFSALVLSGFTPCINDYAVMVLNLRQWLPEAVSPGLEVAWMFSVPVLFVLVSGTLLTAALPVIVRAILTVVRTMRRKGNTL
mmetsp:Transcript_89224/g.266136  ORF Transcript_89224/g.266136 Transcript_89224/m.266136 type:complete len:1217 (+) Transcript_89224:45-3695(+)